MKNLEKEKVIEPYLEVALGYIILALMIKLYFILRWLAFFQESLYAPTPLLLLTIILAGYLVKSLCLLGHRGKT